MTVERSEWAAARAAARLAKQVEVALAAVDLSLPQYRTLAFLDAGPEAASALAGKLAVSRPSVTAIIDGLVQRGLVRREADVTDRRRVHHVLTSDGARTLASADRAVTERLERVASHLDEDADNALDGLARWNDALNRAREAATTVTR